jgi:hypothetical protein
MDFLDQLVESGEKTEIYFNLPEVDLQKSYEKGKWNIRMILVHLSDAESVLHDRIKRVISEPKGVIWAFDQDLWCRNLDYQNFPLEISKGIFTANRKSVIYLAEKYYKTLGHLEFVHSETGLRILKQEFEKVANHNISHLHQIEKALKIKG